MICWIDASAGASGDMLLGALVGAGADVAAIGAAVAAVAPEPAAVRFDDVRRGGLAATQACVDVAESTVNRRLSDVLGLLTAAPIPDPVRNQAADVFRRLAAAEATVHGIEVEEVHFHEVGALDAIVDVVAACTGLLSLGCTRVHGSPVAVGSGHVDTDHGRLGVPVPAVTELLREVPSYAGPAETELCTPTGAALLRQWVTQWGPQPLMAVHRVGMGAGSKDFSTHANVTRIMVGSRVDAGPLAARSGSQPRVGSASDAVVYETNIDDLDPRLWPTVLERLLDAGASDAWLTPILMKKGRPAYTLSVLMTSERTGTVRAAMFAETSSIGLRELVVGKHALERSYTHVDVDGQRIGVKVALSAGQVVNVQPEYDDVAAAAVLLHRPVKAVLAAAVAAAVPLWGAAEPRRED